MGESNHAVRQPPGQFGLRVSSQDPMFTGPGALGDLALWHRDDRRR